MIVYRTVTSNDHPSESEMADQWRQGYQLINVCAYQTDAMPEPEFIATYFYTGGRRKNFSSTNNM